MQKMKKFIVITIVGILMVAFGAYSLIFDDKDHCLDYGGLYNDSIKQCEK